MFEKRIRPAMKEDDAWKLIREIKAVDETLIANKPFTVDDVGMSGNQVLILKIWF